jgi:Chromo (CHRromatin Organisation MOdifier) domain
VPCRTADDAATIDALMRWFAEFGVVLPWILDRGSHFKNEVVRRVQKELKSRHHFTTANFPWSNGTTESACKQVIRAFGAVLSELKMYADEWPEAVNLVQSVLNNSLSTRLNKRTPMQVLTGHAETTPLALVLKDNVSVIVPLDFIKAQMVVEVEKLSKAMTEIHAQVAKKATRDRKAAIQKHNVRFFNDKTHVRSPTFQVGDHMLVAEHRKSGTSKLQVKWKGPRRFASVESDCVFVVENLLTKEIQAAHATRLRFFKDKELDVTAELAQAAKHNDHELYVVSKILDARYNEQEMFHELLVAWRGFPVGDATWEPYSIMAVDVPEMVAKFMESHEDIDTVRKIRSL